MKLLITTIFLFCLFGSFAQTQNDWEKRTAFSGNKRERAISFVVGDTGYVGMGVDTAEMTHNDLWIYIPETSTWTQRASLPGSTRRNAVAVAVGNKAYVGMGADSATSWMGTILADWWEYNPVTNSWIQKSDYPGGFGFVGTSTTETYMGPGMYFGTAFEANGKAYICGGKMGPDQYGHDLWEYDPQTDIWTRKADFPGMDRYQLSSFSIDNLGYVGMGIDHDLYRKDWWQYNPQSDSWIEVSSLPGVERGASSTFVLGQRGFVVFGTDGGFKDELWEYNPFSDSWMIRANFPGGERKNGVAFAIGDSAYAGIGKGASGKRRNFYRYYPLLPVGLEENPESFVVYPNPTSETLNILVTADSEYQFQLVDLKGRQVLTSSNTTFAINNLKAGVYILNIFDQKGNHLKTEKVMIQ